MLTAIVVFVVAFALTAGTVAGWLFAHRLPVIGQRVIVNLTDGTALRGVLTGQRGAWLVLRDVEVLRVDNAAGGPLRMDGAVYLERPRVLFVQVVP